MNISDIIRSFIYEAFLSGNLEYTFSNDDSLLDTAIIDSIGVTELSIFLEDKFGFSVPMEDQVVENFGTVNTLTRYVSRRLAAHAVSTRATR